MATCLDVAAYILNKCGRMPAMKLQKLVYYAQAWALVWDEKPLFQSKFEAWANGPVCPRLYAAHRGMFDVGRRDVNGDPDNLSNSERETIDAVLEHYGSKSALWLSNLTHAEKPWKNARKGLKLGEPGTEEITQDAMAEYYGSLTRG